jgi:short-subunit dehydrogenase
MRKYGRSSTSPRLPGSCEPARPGTRSYGASKAMVIKFSGGARARGAQHGVNVTAVCPGFTKSEFHDVTGTREMMNRMPAWMWMDAPTVARQGYDAVMAGCPDLHQRPRESDRSRSSYATCRSRSCGTSGGESGERTERRRTQRSQRSPRKK